jgi:predicted ATPase with chaperone activity
MSLSTSTPTSHTPVLATVPFVPTEAFTPRAPQTLAEAGLSVADLESLMLKCLLQQGNMTGHKIAGQLRLPFSVALEVLRLLKGQMLVNYKASAPMGDFVHELTDSGMERAQRWTRRSTYCGAAPVPLADYIAAVEKQSLRKTKPKFAQVSAAFNDLSLSQEVLSQIGQAVTAGKGLFLYGSPGNGKTSIAERMIRSFSDTIWIPRTIIVGGEMVRLFDSANHQEVSGDRDALPGESRIDARWVRIRRPTVVVGGELTLEHLEMSVDKVSGIIEAPLQMKSNGGVFVVDDFGRQRCSTAELLNRWIIPLEKGFDFQTLPTGRQILIPFDQLLIFATNMAPKELVDEAFLRRIPYKVEVRDPSEQEFRQLIRQLSDKLGIRSTPEAIDYLITRHYRQSNRPFRYCHVRDLLLQVRNYCEFHERAYELNSQTLDVAVHNYFAGL